MRLPRHFSRIRFRAGAAAFATIAVAWAVAGCRTGGRGSRGEGGGASLEEPPRGDAGTVIAEVNGRPITRGDFYSRVLRRFGTAKILGGVIKEEIFFQEAERLGLEVRKEDIAKQVDRVLEGLAAQAGGEEALLEAYRREGIGIEDLRRDLEREVYPEIVIGKVTMALRKVDDELLRRYYQETYRHDRYRARHTAYGFRGEPGQPEEERNRVKLEAFNRAARAADRVRKGADFPSLARAESEDTVTASRGGDLGFIHEDSPMEPSLRKAVLSLGRGEVSDPVENPNGGYHVFQVTEVVPGESFVDCKEKMRAEILEREPDMGEIEAALRALRERSEVRILGSPFTPDPTPDAGREVPSAFPRLPAGEAPPQAGPAGGEPGS
jgi:parvulin-like peptidyl-prolyl isomerase